MASDGVEERRIRTELAAVLDEWRQEKPPFDEGAFRARAIAMAEASRDQELVDAVWDYREGTIDRVELRRHPAYVRQAERELEDLRDRMGRSGIIGALHDR